MKNLRTLVGVAGGLGLLMVASTGLAAAETGGVSASGTNNAKMTVTISDATSDFGTSLDPNGTDSNSSDTVLDYQGSTGNQGTYYVWKSAGAGVDVTVKSNKVWSGTVDAAENAGTSTTMTIASGVLKFAETTAPTTYAGCGSATNFSAMPQTWKTSIGAGVNKYTSFYCLRVDWDDAPGTFSSSITYTATQA